ncbi:response regulator transcription factor [Roseibium sp. SCP14]|uniref:response regulator transcription factor n=1 Tax=Roseibium sp. SCP14 TaxID=3141375 RepID=UPI00333C2C2E
MRVLIVEDDVLHRSFLREVIERELPDVTELIEAKDGDEGIALAAQHCPHAIVMDLQMPNRTGVDAARAIWRKEPETRILFWSNYADEAYVRGISRIVPVGASYGYILKSASEDRLKLALQGVFVEEQCIIDRAVRGVQQRADDRLQGLTDSEYEVLIDIALGLTDRTISRRRGISLRSVQSRLQSLYEKLGVDQETGRDTGGAIYNSRSRAVSIAFLRRLINGKAIEAAELDYQAWFASLDNEVS